MTMTLGSGVLFVGGVCLLLLVVYKWRQRRRKREKRRERPVADSSDILWLADALGRGDSRGPTNRLGERSSGGAGTSRSFSGEIASSGTTLSGQSTLLPAQAIQTAAATEAAIPSVPIAEANPGGLAAAVPAEELAETLPDIASDAAGEIAEGALAVAGEAISELLNQ